jgi:hypothetical protein
MFLVQQMLRTKDKEIERLAAYNEMRVVGLMSSQKMLETDTRSFLDFFTDIKKKTSDANADLEKKKKERNDLTLDSRNKNEEIQSIKTTINKNME